MAGKTRSDVPTAGPSALRASVTLAALFAVMACSASGTQLPSAPTTSAAERPSGPTSAAQDSQEAVVSRICQQQTTDVSVSKCGDFYSTYPTGFIVDAATEIYDRNGAHIDSCGGNRYYTSDAAREEAERKCAQYLTSCTRIVESCQK
jgi:hypothetical protein